MKRLLLLLTLIGMLAFAGCASMHAPTPSGFLGHDAHLTPVPGQNALASFIDSPADLIPFRAILVDPVVFNLPAERPQLPVAEQAALGQRLQAIIEHTCATHRRVVPLAGPEVLRLRTVVTSLRTSNPVLNGATTLLVFVPADLGGLAVEFELVDSISGHRLAAYVADRSGTPLQPFSALRRTGHAEAAFARISHDFLDNIWPVSPPAPSPSDRPKTATAERF